MVYIESPTNKHPYLTIYLAKEINQNVLCYRCLSLDADETVFNMNDNSWLTHVDTNNTVSTPFHNELTENNNYSYWRPCTTLCRILNHLTNDDFAQFPCIPCSYCYTLIRQNG